MTSSRDAFAAPLPPRRPAAAATPQKRPHAARNVPRRRPSPAVLASPASDPPPLSALADDLRIDPSQPAPPSLPRGHPGLVVDADELGLLRQRFRLLRAQLADAVDAQDFLRAADLRDTLADMSRQDPQMLFADLTRDLQLAVAREDYPACCTLRDNIDNLKQNLPQFALGGLWAGIYGQRGVEKVHITIDGNELRAKKLTGDINVPAGELTFWADLSPDGLVDGAEGDAIERALHMFPHLKNIQRFRGEGQIAEAGFKNPRWIPGELILFEEGVVAFVWKSLAFLVIFERMTEMK